MTTAGDPPVRPTVEIHADGACSGNPGPGAWAAILRFGEVEKVLVGGARSTTNNRMELTAALEALKALKRPCDVRLHSDSAYLVSAFVQGWLANWRTNGWKNAGKDPVSNQDLWVEIDRLAAFHRIEWIKVKGHSDDALNNRCDKLAVEEIGRWRTDAAQPVETGSGG